MGVLSGSYTTSDIFCYKKLVSVMLPGFHSMLWHAHSSSDEPPTLAFSIFKEFCLNVSIFSLYTKSCSQLVEVNHF